MPQLNLTDLEAKVAWLIVDRERVYQFADTALQEAERKLFAKLYRAYRGMPTREAS